MLLNEVILNAGSYQIHINLSKKSILVTDFLDIACLAPDYEILMPTMLKCRRDVHCGVVLISTKFKVSGNGNSLFLHLP